MVINLNTMKRKRREECLSPLLDDSPKRTKVHAQRKFAQGSNVNSPVITPVKEVEKQEVNVLPEPVELLPIKRPNTEDFLTFLCFRGTPLLPPSLNFFNTASIVDTNGQVHEIKSESPKNGPIDTSAITKSGPSERPFIAFGVRKRADPIVISRQMDKKRRHALTLQALRRKYQEQRMAKIRAVTISKLSEKVTNKTLVRSNSVPKSETITKKTTTLQKTKVISTKHVKLKTGLRSKIKPKMCLRSFRGRFVQRELQFRNVTKKILTSKKIQEKIHSESGDTSSEYTSEDEESMDDKPKNDVPRVAKKSAPGPKKPMELNFRITRSTKFLNNKMTSRRQQIKQRIMLTSPKNVKPRTLRSQTAQKTKVLIKTKEKLLNLKSDKQKKENDKLKSADATLKESQKTTDETKKEIVKSENMKKQIQTSKTQKAVQGVKVNKTVEVTKKELIKTVETNKEGQKSVVVINKVTNKSSEHKDKSDPSKLTSKTSKKSDQKPVEKKKEMEIRYQSESKSSGNTSNDEDIPIKEHINRKTNKYTESTESRRTSQRPTRKTKEAAAIYMEILSHKLVNEDKIDDDNVSIDSFPELPNVKRTEQRENELKAKAKNTRSNDSDSNETESKKINSNKRVSRKNILKQESKKGDKTINKILDSDEESKINDKRSSRSKKVADKSKTHDENESKKDDRPESIVHKGKMKPQVILKKEELIKNRTKYDSKDKNSKRKVQNESSSESEESIIKTRSKKVEINEGVSTRSRKIIEQTSKRQTRNSQGNTKTETEDSDESFFIDIRIPKKKQVTRSKNTRGLNNCDEENDQFFRWDDEVSNKKSSRAPTVLYKEFSSSTESDDSTTSDVITKKTTSATNKPKRFTKTKNQQTNEGNFSDSDEEPLSNLTKNKANDKEATEVKPQSKVEEKQTKPKRECAKRPQNYLPMFSSSDEDEEYFLGFGLNSEKNTNLNVDVTNCSIHIPSSDLLLKDIGRRFGKGRVNMSNEQIEKWLKDSAMAGTSGKRDDEEMMDYVEKIPTETFSNIAQTLDTEKLKLSLLSNHEEKMEGESVKSNVSPEIKSVSTPEKNVDKPNSAKSIVGDRKLIFRKEKVTTVPNKNAFSANNESSVYAFGEESEDVMKTPFRRLSRRPSSTATSKSEDESFKFEESSKTGHFRKPSLLKQDSVKSVRDADDSNTSLPNQTNDNLNIESSQTESDDNSHLFYTPLQPFKTFGKSKSATSMSAPSAFFTKTKSDTKIINRQYSKSNDRFSETSEDFKYKIPSSPSASSSSSAKLYRKTNAKLKSQSAETLPLKLGDFPTDSSHAKLVEAPTFYPNDKEFQDPIEYIDKIRVNAEKFGICRIVPPSTFKPECKINDDMRFTAYNQYVHKMLHRWGPNFKEFMAIRKYLSTQNITLNHPPWIGGMEVDLPRLYQTVQSLGGLKEVIEKKKWPKVSDMMKIPKFAQDRVTKLDDIYCKYLLPYDTLSPDEREKLFDEVETEWAKRESKTLLKMQENINDNSSESSDSYDEAEECIVKGRSIALNAFYRIARNTMSMWFRTNEPSPEEVEQEFWKHVTDRQNHICVNSGSIDSGNWGYGFATSKNSPFARHAWNLKVLTNNSGSILRSLGPIMGVTVPTIHVGMVFSACCWYKDPHTLPWIEYLHTGGSKIWYGIPDSASVPFQTALKKLVPNYCRNKPLWLPSDTAMVPPNILVDNGVSLSRLVQQPGQFVVIFPKVFTSSLSTGYVVSESVYFATPRWLETAEEVFEDLKKSCESSMFSLERLLLSIANDARSSIDVLKQIRAAIVKLCDKEKLKRKELKDLNVIDTEKLPSPDAPNIRKKRKMQKDDGDNECKICRMNLFVSMVMESQEDLFYCLDHAVDCLQKDTIQSKDCKFLYTYEDKELEAIIEKIDACIEYKLQKKIVHKYSGMPTMLTK